MEAETTSLAKVDPRTHGALVLKQALQEAGEQRALLKEYVAKHMVESTDFGKIPGTDKPTLLKPGAEKLVDLFRCTPKFALISKEEDFERGFFNYMFRVRLYSRDAEAILAEGFGSANSREGRYRWRNANRKCPACGKESIIAGKAEYGGGWLCFKKKGGCGAKFDSMASEITSQAQGQVENDDIATLANTILKMAKKRALVDGAIALARCSDLFTQDVEDLEPQHPPEEPQRQAATRQEVAKAQAKPPPQSKPAPSPAPGKAPCAPGGHEWSLDGKCQLCGTPEGEAKPVNPAKQSPQLRARAVKVWKEATGRGMSPDSFQAWTKDVLGRTTASVEWTEAEIELLEAALAHGAREPGDEG